MRFRNAHAHALDFDLGGTAYHVAAGTEVVIPTRIAYAVARRGLPLTPVEGSEGEEPGPTGDADHKPTDPAARLWWERAHAMRSEAMALDERVRQLERHADDARHEVDQARGFVDAVRSRLALGPDASVLEALDTLLADLARVTAERDELLAAPPAASEAPAGDLTPAEPAKPGARKPR